MPLQFNAAADQLEFARYYAWSWPDDAPDMSDTEARLRVPRASAGGPSSSISTPMNGDGLAQYYGQLLADGRAQIQQSHLHGDRLPRTAKGAPLTIEEQIAADVAEKRLGVEPRVYQHLGNEHAAVGADLLPRWGTSDPTTSAVWLPDPGHKSAFLAAPVGKQSDAGDVLRSVHGYGAMTPEQRDAVWDIALERGRNMPGRPEALAAARSRLSPDVEVNVALGVSEAVVTAGPRGGVDVEMAVRVDSPRLAAADALYGHLRGTLAMQHGPPAGREEAALDALTASIVSSRGTNAVCLGWNPPEPELLREAGRVLEKHPDRLDDVIDRSTELERLAYPTWSPPEREKVLVPEPEHPETDERGSPPREARLNTFDIFDDIREAARRTAIRYPDRVVIYPPEDKPEMDDRPKTPRPEIVLPDQRGPSDGYGPEGAPEPAGTPQREPERPRGRGGHDR